MQKQASKPIPLVTLKAKQKKINLKPDFQRNEVWSRKTKQMLIDSVLRDIPIPEVFFKETENDGFEFDVVDGQQRIRTIYQFMDNEFKTKRNTIINGVNVGGLYYSQLPEEFKEQVDSYSLNYVAIRGTNEEIEDMFRRFQSGVNIKNVEARNSISGKIREVKQALLKHPFFVDDCMVEGKINMRMQFDELVEQIILLELYGIQDVKNSQINKMYEDYNESGIPSEVVDKITTVLDYLHKGFGEYEMEGYLKKTAIQGIYLVLMDYIHEDPSMQSAQSFSEWFYDFETNRKIYRAEYNSQENLFNSNENAEIYNMYKEYDFAMQGGTARKESLEIRRDVLLTSWKKWLAEN